MQQELRKFDKKIHIEVDVDFVAATIYNIMDKSNPHAALLTNAIVGCAMQDQRLGQLFSAASGYAKQVNIEVGKSYEAKGCDLLDGTYQASQGHREGTSIVQVKEVNEYRVNGNVLVTFKYFRKDETLHDAEQWIEATKLYEVPAERIVTL